MSFESFEMKVIVGDWKQIFFSNKGEMEHVLDAWILTDRAQTLVGMVIQLSFGWVSMSTKNQHPERKAAFLDEEMYLINKGWTFGKEE